MASTTGTNTALTRSTSRWIGALRAWASSTSRTMRASVVSAPTAPVRTSSLPSPLIAPPVTRAPGDFATGRLSPVSRASSAVLSPSSTVPSTAMRSPGRTTTRSPTRTRPIGISISLPSARRTNARSGRSAVNARIAAPVCRRARPSSHLPSSTRVMTTAAASKYRCGAAACRTQAAISRYRLIPYAAEVPSATSRSMLPAPARAAFQPAT